MLSLINKEHPKYGELSPEDILQINLLQDKCELLIQRAKESEEIAIELFTQWEDMQYELQGLWGFPKNPIYHRSYTFPFCSCPKLDNAERYPMSQIIISNCKIHKKEIKK